MAADSDETLSPLVMSAGVGAVGVAGTVAVNTIQSTTEATVARYSGTRPSLFNQDPAYQTGVNSAQLAVQTVIVSADDTAAIDGDVRGTAAVGGFAGVRASVDVGGHAQSDVAAHIGGHSVIGALNDVSVLLHESRSIGFVCRLVCGRICAASSAAVSVQSLGASTDSMAATEFDRSVNGGQTLQKSGSMRRLFTPDVEQRDQLPRLRHFADHRACRGSACKWSGRPNDQWLAPSRDVFGGSR